MQAWLMDAYRRNNRIVLWMKTPAGEDFYREYDFTAVIYTDPEAAPVLRRRGIGFHPVIRKTYFYTFKEVLAVPVPRLDSFERFVRELERTTRHRMTFYNADIPPEQMFLYQRDLTPCGRVEVRGFEIFPLKEETFPPLTKLQLNVIPAGEIRPSSPGKNSRPAALPDIPLRMAVVNGEELRGTEPRILRELVRLFHRCDPDVIEMDCAYSRLPYLDGRLRRHHMYAAFHRWHPRPIHYRGGRSYWSYGQVRYQDYAVKLRGRFLIDRNSFVGTECDVEGVMELVRLSGTLFQTMAARSFGAVFQTALIRLLIRNEMLVAYKEKPLEQPLSMLEMLKSDRAGLTIDPKVGFHRDVAEIDFTSMFPWLIYNHNISAECILTDEGPFDAVPGIPVRASRKRLGLIPAALKPFIDRRMYYKANPTPVNKQRAKGLKWVLVSCYGYLRFREFKLGIPTSHMAICAYARETLLKSIHLAEDAGYNIIHAIVDSLYLQKTDISAEDVASFCLDLELATGIPVSFEGVFKWVVFLPSVVDPHRALPSTYYGVFRNGEIKARGIEVRQRGSPALVKAFQHNVLEQMKTCDTKAEILAKIPTLFQYLRLVVEELPNMKPSLLTVLLRVGKTEYKKNIPQKRVVERLKEKGVRVVPGQFIELIHQDDGAVPAEEYNGKPDKPRYQKLLVRALFVLLQPFGYTKADIAREVKKERQMELAELKLYVERLKSQETTTMEQWPQREKTWVEV
ncbi:MAG: hypothetical protein K8I00_08680 [Candidatus Omnitrophica bacterium]|nr:hypothetical protein [Candidatus Omnitrophota bacterium]